MSQWDHRNFEDDHDLNQLVYWINMIIKQIREAFTYEKSSLYGGQGRALIVINVDILGTIYNSYNIYHDLQLSEVTNWKEEYLKTFDDFTRNNNKPLPIEYVELRRPEIEKTFEKLISIVKVREEEEW